MCGITGLINCGDEQVLGAMTDLVSHRGPDDEGTIWFKTRNSGLGHRRLSIIDLSEAAHQPMSALDGRLWIVFNGEIYNYKEIQKRLIGLGHVFKSNSDTEVILRSYVEWGDDCVNEFNGMFAFAIYDLREHKLFAARDRIGIKPFYYKDRGKLAVIGRAAAVVDLMTLRFTGYLAWLLWLFIHLLYLVGFRNRLIVLIQWAWSYITRNRGARLITRP